jgi:CubicO group peptidase (beta-lactamase class C family)
MGPRRQLEPEDIFDWDRVCTALAEAEPWFEPGSAAAYHGITFGFLVGEVVRRVSGLSIGEFLRVNVTEPLGIEREVYVGCPPSEQSRCATLIGTIGADPDNPVLAQMQQAFLANLHPSLASFGRLPVPFDNNSVAWRAAEIPAANGQMTARGLATIYGALANRGEWHGTHIVNPEAIERMRERQGDDGDLLISAMGVPDFNWLSGFMANPDGLGSNRLALGHSGAGGSYGFADPEHRVSFAYVMNKMAMVTVGVDERVTALTRPLYDTLDVA